jgi:hypothetical protein
MRSGDAAACEEYQRLASKILDDYGAALAALPDIDPAGIRVDDRVCRSLSGEGLDFQIIIDDYVPRAFRSVGADGRYSVVLRWDWRVGLYDHQTRSFVDVSERELVLVSAVLNAAGLL